MCAGSSARAPSSRHTAAATSPEPRSSILRASSPLKPVQAVGIHCRGQRRSRATCGQTAWITLAGLSHTTRGRAWQPHAAGGCCATSATRTSPCSTAGSRLGCGTVSPSRQATLRRPPRGISARGRARWRCSMPTAHCGSRHVGSCLTPERQSALAASMSLSIQSLATCPAQSTGPPRTTWPPTGAFSLPMSSVRSSRLWAWAGRARPGFTAARGLPRPTRSWRSSSRATAQRCMQGPGASGSPIRRGPSRRGD